jgi:putative transposase
MRTHVCKCGFVLDRDWNAAINILKLALSTVGHTGTWVDDFGVSAQSNAERSRSIDPNASGDSTSTQVGAILLGQVGSMNEESPRL